MKKKSIVCLMAAALVCGSAHEQYSQRDYNCFCGSIR